ncbi:MAG: two pore domain potassium channel family protein [Alphaproteobacteria bacterium]|nr:two pore domain potassium channel family protein [Alphaproteobacteria bacterium]
MLEFILTGLLGALLIAACCLNIYELLRHAWSLLPRLTWPPHVRVLAVVASMFLAHIINIWLFGFVYYVLHYYELGTLTGAEISNGHYKLDIFGCLYFSAVIYSTLGLGDITPQGALRMITGVEGLTGFILIGWTVSFTYLAMQKFWELPHRRK